MRLGSTGPSNRVRSAGDGVGFEEAGGGVCAASPAIRVKTSEESE